MTEMAYRAAPPVRRDLTGVEDWWRTVDRWTLGAVIVLCTLGMVLALAATPPLADRLGQWTYTYVLRQGVFTALALGLVFGISMLPLVWLRRGGVILCLAFAGLVALLPLIGTDFGKGAVRWISLPGFSLQPSEFLKPGFVILSAWLLSGAQQGPGAPPGRLISGIVAAGLAGLLVIQPDFGQAVLLMAVWVVMLFVSGTSVVLLLGLGALIGCAGTVAYFNSDHFAGRIDKFLAGTPDPHTQLAYALAAIREGGLFGVGAAQGSVKWTLPDAHTDFIIAVAAEEFGLLVTLVIILLYLAITLRALMLLLERRDPFVRIAGAGLAVLFGLQAFINFGVAIQLLPAKGMTLPFLSHGGSSMISVGLTMGALLALTRARPHDVAAHLRMRL